MIFFSKPLVEDGKSSTFDFYFTIFCLILGILVFGRMIQLSFRNHLPNYSWKIQLDEVDERLKRLEDMIKDLKDERF